jgi:hypothetical protein
MTSKKVLVWSSVEGDIKELVKTLAASKGISLSEYIRELILSDLDGRSVFTSNLKESMEGMAVKKEFTQEGSNHDL